MPDMAPASVRTARSADMVEAVQPGAVDRGDLAPVLVGQRAQLLLLEGGEDLPREQLTRGEAGGVVDLVPEVLPLHVHAGEEVREPAHTGFGQHQGESGMP